jgi:hypothetical protein
MIGSKSVRRAFVLTTALAACAAPNAAARVADAPVHNAGVSTVRVHQVVPPRVDGIGVQPSHPTTVPAVPLTQPSHDGGFDWRSALIGVAALLSLALLSAAAWTTVRARRATSPRGSA